MTLPVFFLPTEILRGGNSLTIAGSEGRHASVVRRLGPGEHVILTDGLGLVVRGRILAAERSQLTVEVLEREQRQPPSLTLVVVQALAKGERGERAVALLTEVGVDTIVPWAASRCIARWEGHRVERGLGRWRTTARESAKQSRRVWWPEITELATTKDVAQRIARADLSLVLSESAHVPLDCKELPSNGTVVVVVGPEGGITDEEQEQFGSAGAASVRIGPHVLRTSTAGVVAASVILSHTERWSESSGGA